MAVIDYLVSDAPQSVFLFPTPQGGIGDGAKTGLPAQNPANNADPPLYFQYWPQTLNDNYAVEYATHKIPGGSHPLYQWVGGSGRTLSFTAVFTAEINMKRSTNLVTGGINNQQARQRANVANAISTSLIPSSQYTVDVSAAIARLRSWMMPKYGNSNRVGRVGPPKILTLVFPGTKLSGRSGGTLSNTVTVILTSAPVTYESWFPDGTVRVATVNLSFNEVVQTPGNGSSRGKVEFIGRDDFEETAKGYKFRGLPNRPWFGG